MAFNRTHQPLCYALFTLWVLVVSTSGQAQSAPVYALSDESADGINISAWSSHLVDESGTLMVDELPEAAAPVWQVPGLDHLRLGLGDRIHWIRLTIANRGKSPQRRLLELNSPLIDSVEVWIRHQDGEVHYQLGNMQPFQDNIIPHRNTIVPIVLPAGQATEVLLRLQANQSLTFPVLLSTEDALQARDTRDRFLAGLFLGLMLFIFCHTIYLWLRQRKPHNLYFLLYAVCLTLFNAAQSGFGYQFIWPDSHWLNDRAPVLFTSLSAAFGAWFSVSFLSLYKLAPVSARILIGLAFANGMLAVSTLVVPYGALVGLVLLTSACTAIVTTITAALVATRFKNYATLFLAAWVALTIGIVIYALHQLGLTPYSELTRNSFLLGSTVELLLLALALSEQLQFQAGQRLQQQTALTRACERRESELHNQQQQLQTENDNYRQLLQQADRLDSTTGLLNLTAFHQEMAREHGTALRYGNTLSVIVLELSDLRQINETRGYQAGDAWLAAVARFVSESLHRPGDLAGRITGSRLAIVLPYTDIDGAIEVVQRIKRNLAAWQQQQGTDAGPIKLKAGIASTESRLARHPDDLIESATAQIREIREHSGLQQPI